MNKTINLLDPQYEVRIWRDDTDGLVVSFFCPDCNLRLYLTEKESTFAVRACECPHRWSFSITAERT